MSYLKINNVSKIFDGTKVLKSVSIDIKEGEFVCLLGPSGCGKTTLLRIISGLESQNEGEIYLDNKDISNLYPSERNIGIVFQNYVLFPNMTIFKNIAYGLENKKLPKKEITKKVEEVLEKVGLLHLKDRYPNQLSGGQQQRVAIARAIVLSPKILLLDEPLSALDAKVREYLRQEIKRLQKELGITTVMVTHDQEEALTMADKIVVMNNSEVVQIGNSEEIYKYPKNKFVADFIGKVNFIENKDSLLAVRPEDVLFSMNERDGYKKSKVEGIEFRGAFYRLEIKTEDENKIVVDILSNIKDKFELEIGKLMYIKFDRSITIVK